MSGISFKELNKNIILTYEVLCSKIRKNVKRLKNVVTRCVFWFIGILERQWKAILKVLSFLICTVGTGFITYYNFFNESSFTATIQIVDWNDKIGNEDIYNKGVVYIDGNPVDEITKTNNGTFKFQSDKERKINVYFQPKEKHQFMKLDTTIFLSKDSSDYRVKMYFKGIDKITSTVKDKITREPVEGAIAEIEGVSDTTKTDGKFTILLTPDKQKRIQKLVIKKEGFDDYDKKLDLTAQSPEAYFEICRKK